ncbi:MAG: SpoIID/LytB domain-containing protein, partial [Armatimonadota bacterium]
MAYHEWLAALLVACSLHRTGALPKTVTFDEVAPHLLQRAPIRIGVAQYAKAVKALPTGRGVVVFEKDGERSSLPLPAGRPILARPDGDRIVIESPQGEVRCSKATVRAPGKCVRVYSWGAQTRSGVYGGEVEIALDPHGSLSAINVLPLESYLVGVVAAEVPVYFHSEALKAQAIIARTYALFNLGKHERQGFDLCDGVHCQQYRGHVNITRVRAAVTETKGCVLTYNGCLAETVYHAVCGGFVDDPYRVWDGYLMPYLRATADAPRGAKSISSAEPTEPQVVQFLAEQSSYYCARSPRYRWRRTYAAAEMQRLLDANLRVLTGDEEPPGRLIEMKTDGRSPGGRVQTLHITTDRGEYDVKRNDIRWIFGDGKPGPNGLPSTLLCLHTKRDDTG